MERKTLDLRLRARRYEKATEECAKVLAGIGISAARQRPLPLSESGELWPRYLARLRSRPAALRWPVGERGGVIAHVESIADGVEGMRAVWLALVGLEPVGFEVPAAELLRSAPDYLVSSAGDLMLATESANDGICIELNHLASGDEYEIVTWGAFQR